MAGEISKAPKIIITVKKHNTKKTALIISTYRGLEFEEMEVGSDFEGAGTGDNGLVNDQIQNRSQPVVDCIFDLTDCVIVGTCF